MNLAELRELAEAEENQEVNEDQSELDIESPDLELAEDEAETSTDGESAGSEDFELELESETEDKPKYDAKSALTHKLSKQRKRAQRAESEVETLREEINQLKQAMQAPQAASQPAQAKYSYGSSAPVPPDLYSSEIGGDQQKFAIAHSQYMSDWNQWQQAQLAPQVQAEQQQNEYRNNVAKKADSLGEKAEEFIQSNKIKPQLVVEAIEVAKDEIDETAGLDGAFVHLLDSVEGDTAKVAYHIGRNETARNKLKSLINSDPSGLKAVSYLTNLTKLKPKTRVMSNAPAPDEPVKGDAGSVTAEQWRSRYNKETDPQKMLEMRRKARSAGISLD